MTRTVALAIAALSMAALAADKKTDEAKATEKAKAAITGWLKLADAGDGAKTWDSAGAVFKGAVTQADWSKALSAARGPYGKLKSRELKSATFATRLPGAPDGEYVVAQFDAKFEQQAGIETVTASHEKDGAWKVVGYFIK